MIEWESAVKHLPLSLRKWVLVFLSLFEQRLWMDVMPLDKMELALMCQRESQSAVPVLCTCGL
jgi:hypothetical protein